MNYRDNTCIHTTSIFTERYTYLFTNYVYIYIYIYTVIRLLIMGGDDLCINILIYYIMYINIIIITLH